jgi:hypothetical protein
MIRRVCFLSLLVGAHLVAWAITFVVLVGPSPKLVPSYFVMGWSFSGGELPSFVWLYSWGVFLVLLGVFFATKRLIARRAANA